MEFSIFEILLWLAVAALLPAGRSRFLRSTLNVQTFKRIGIPTFQRSPASTGPCSRCLRLAWLPVVCRRADVAFRRISHRFTSGAFWFNSLSRRVPVPPEDGFLPGLLSSD